MVLGHGTDNAWDEAVRLVLAVTGLPDDTATLDEPLSAADWLRVRELLTRRIDERLPLPYLLGRITFAGLEFEIEPGVVIPRSPIGRLIEQEFAPWLTQPPQRIVDLCCGSGCIGIAAAARFPDSQLTLVDIDEQALDVARRNVRRHGLKGRTRLICSDLWAEVPAGRFDLVLCNPPYVDAADMRTLPPEFLHEPELGLAGGEDGLAVLRPLLAALPERLAEDGLLVGEVGRSAAALTRAFPELPFVWPDLESGGEGVFLLLSALAC